jgi:polysaccharide pyruvyl transferase WcaK-like protein
MANLLSNLSSGTKIAGVSAVALVAILNGKPTASNATLPIVTTGTNPPPPATNGDAPQSGAPSNTPIYASGNAANAPTALRKSNQSIAHVCNLPASVNQALFKAGAMGGQIIQAIRNGIKALLKALGINPSTNGIASQLKKLAQYIKDATKFVKDMTKYINGLIVYVNAIKQLISYLLSLPGELLSFFKDCLQKAYAQLQAGYLSVVSEATSTNTNSSDSIIAEVQNVLQSTTQLITASTQLAAAPFALVSAALQPGQTPVANSAAQAAATQAVFSAAGFSPNAATQKP